jgi:zinc protease
MPDLSKKYILSNGLTVIHENVPKTGVVSLNIGVSVGSADENESESGLCHLIEHMVFKGTTSFAPGEIATVVEANGGDLNAYTSMDQTVYYINLPSESLKLGLNILKEMVFEADMDKVELEREKEVVVEEIRRGLDNPHRVLSQAVFSSLYQKHPYHRPIIGTEAHVRGFSRAKLHGFYKKHYQPQNMVLGICGDIDEKEVKRLVKSLFGPVKGGSKKTKRYPQEKMPSKHQFVKTSMPIQSTHFDLAFLTVAAAHPDCPALDLLSHLLGESPTSLLEKNTRESEELVHYIYSSSYTPKSAGLFSVGALVDPQKLEAALVSVKKQIQTSQKVLFDAQDIERAKELFRSRSIYEKETCDGTAKKWMTYETTLGDHLYDDVYLKELDQVTAEDIRRVANQYLDVTRSCLVVLHPDGQKVQVKPSFFKVDKALKKTAFKVKKKYRDLELYQLKSGLRVLMKRSDRVPLVSMKLTGLGGLRYETPSQNGLYSLMAHTMPKGTQTQSFQDLSIRLEKISANVSAYAGRNSWGVSASTLSENLNETIEVFSDVVLNPAFEANEVRKEKVSQLESIKNKQDEPAQMAIQKTYETLFDRHPFSMPMLGEAKTVNRFTEKNLFKLHQNSLATQDLVISVVGDAKPDETLEALENHFSSLKRGKANRPQIKKPKALKRQEYHHIKMKKEQSHVVVGFSGVSMFDPDRYVLDVIHSILSGQGGRLFLELRDKQSLAYTVTPISMEGLEAGMFGFYIGTEPKKVETALKGIFHEIEKISTETVSSIELERAQNYIIGNHLISQQKLGGMALNLALNELYGHPLNEYYDFAKKVKRVKSSDVKRVARKYFTPEACVVSVVGM